jgi:hypothetical protein
MGCHIQSETTLHAHAAGLSKHFLEIELLDLFNAETISRPLSCAGRARAFPHFLAAPKWVLSR